MHSMRDKSQKVIYWSILSISQQGLIYKKTFCNSEFKKEEYNKMIF